MIPALIAPSAVGQSNTTIATYATTTGFSQVLTVFSTLSNSTQVDHLTINPPSPEACGATQYDLVRGNPGDEVTISISSTQNLDLFVFPNVDAYTHWEYGNPCDFASVSNALVKEQGVSSYAFQVILHQNVLVIAFLYTSQGAPAANITVTQVAYHPLIATIERNVTVTNTIESLTISNLNATETSTGGSLATWSTVEFAVLSISVIFAIGFVFYKIVSNKPKKKTKSKPKNTRKPSTGSRALNRTS